MSLCLFTVGNCVAVKYQATVAQADSKVQGQICYHIQNCCSCNLFWGFHDVPVQGQCACTVLSKLANQKPE